MIAGIGATAIYILRLIPSTETVGDILMWVLKILPSYCLNNSLVFSAGKSALAALRPDVNVQDFNIENMSGDILLLAAHFVFWTFILILVEMGALNCLRTFTFRKKDIP